MKKAVSLTLLSLAFSFPSFAQFVARESADAYTSEPQVENPKAEEIFRAVELQAEFKEGNVNKWIAERIRYPQRAIENYIQGRVIVQFVVEKDGSISNIRIAKGVDRDLDREAERVIREMARYRLWFPAQNNGVPVRSLFTLPVNFKLSHPQPE